MSFKLYILCLIFLFSTGTIFGAEPDIEIITGPKYSISTNQPFSITLNVDQDYGYFSTNNSEYYEFSKGNQVIHISNTTSVKYYGHNGLQKSMTYSVKYSFDYTPPQLIIYGDPEEVTIANDIYTFSGNANDANGVLAVYYQLNSRPWTNAQGKAYWSINLSGLSNTNTVSVFAIDIAGNHSPTNQFTIYLLDPDETAQVHIKNLHIRDDIYTLYANANKIAVISNSNFSKIWNIDPTDTSYLILIRNRDMKDVVNKKIDLKKGESTSFSYQATGFAKIESIQNKSLNKEYIVLIDGIQVDESNTISGLDVTLPHYAELTCLRRCDTLDSVEFYVKDGETNYITLTQPEERKFFLKLFGLYGSYGNIGFELFLNRKFWFGLNAGMTYTQHNDQSLSFTGTPSFEVGYLIAGDRTAHTMLGLGVGFGAHIPFPSNILIAQGLTQEIKPFGAVFLQLEWRFLFGRVGAAFYPQSAEWVAFLPAAGFKF